jgi:hypothetical protein
MNDDAYRMGPRTFAPIVHAPLDFRTRSGGRKSKKDGAFITCPKCDEPCFIRRSIRITETVKHLVSHCTNTGCGHTFLAELAFVHSFNPGLIERPDLNLTVCPRDKVPHTMARSPADQDPNQISMFDPG